MNSPGSLQLNHVLANHTDINHPNDTSHSELEYEFECVCGGASLVITEKKCKGDDMYFCNKCEKTQKHRGNKYCDVCGPMCHRKGKQKGHVFNSKDIVLLNDIIETKEYASKALFGRMILRRMIGTELFNQIKPVLDKFNSLDVTVGIGGISLTVELLAHFLKLSDVNCGYLPLIILSGVAFVSACELGQLAYQWQKNDISVKELMELSGKNVLKDIAVWGGTSHGAAMGIFASQMYGMTGLAGDITGVAVGVFAGYVIGFMAGKCVTTVFDWIVLNQDDKERKRRKEAEQLARQAMISKALSYFHYQPNDVKNKELFNKKELKKRFKRFALDAHPDRRNGDHTEWGVLSIHFGILTALCETRHKNMIVNKVSALKPIGR